MNRHTIFILKKDAVVRGIRDAIRTEIAEFYDILKERDIVISRELAIRLRELDWKNKWHPYPSEKQREYCLDTTIGEVVALLCKIRGTEDAIQFGKRLRGYHPIPHMCAPDSIRGKFADKSVSIVVDESQTGFLCDSKGEKIGFVPNIVHTVDDETEFREHLAVFFEDVDPEKLK